MENDMPIRGTKHRRVTCEYCNHLIARGQLGAHQKRCIDRTPEEREQYFAHIERNRVHAAAYAQRQDAANGQRGQYIVTNARPVQAELQLPSSTGLAEAARIMALILRLPPDDRAVIVSLIETAAVR